MKSIIKSFIRDQVFFSIFYFLSSFLVILFYCLVTKGEVEVIYPLLISVFIYIVYISISFFRYYSFNSKIIMCVENKNYDLPAYSIENKKVREVIENIHQLYSQEIEAVRIADRNKNRFTSQWIHSMKTPVSVMDIILSKEELEASDIESMKEENNKLLSYLEQVLVLIRLEEFSKDFSLEKTDLVANLKKIISSKKSQFIYNHIFPKLNETQPVIVLTDLKWNTMIIEQIINNAIKYSADENSQKSVYFQVQSSGGKTVLSIRDEGIGIPEYDLNRLSEPFFTGENGREYKNSTGIGLYLCFEIAKKLGHTIDITSDRGKGTTVKITYLSEL